MDNHPTHIGSLFCGVCRNKDAKKHFVKVITKNNTTVEKHLLYCIDCYNKMEQKK